MIIFKLLKDQWFGIIIIIILIVLQLKSDQSINLYKNQIKDLYIQLNKYEVKDKLLTLKIDSLFNLEKNVVEKIKTIKEKEYVQIKVVDSLPISKLQQFFTNRYSEK